MYINTFYSFKGGVGRTMALANVAVHLARRGRRVLLVDFDLEAPGLDIFPALRPEEALRGLVDYVAEYLETDQAPDVRDFVGKSPAFDNMLVMPSGAMARGFAASFGQFDWGALYTEREGYLFFEDLKAQWREAFSPDYVLIDSRTGFTDTSGICTRQLPEAVTVLFSPTNKTCEVWPRWWPTSGRRRSRHEKSRSNCTSSCPTCPISTMRTTSSSA